MRLSKIIAFRLVTGDPDAALRFYTALGFEPAGETAIEAGEAAMLGIAGGGRRYAITCGDQRLELDRFDAGGAPYPRDADAASSCFQHLALVTTSIEAMWRLATSAGATPIGDGEPVTLPESAGGVSAVKFHDPEGHPLELIAFPDAAERGWKGEGLLGIDHSAITVADPDRSTRFYRGLGLATGEGSVNHGPTQERLDGLSGVRVDVIPMQPDRAPPHVELLHYRTPAVSAAARWNPSDIAATRIVWQGDAPALLRDPDGHLHQIAG